MPIVADCRLHYAYSRSRLWREAVTNLLESLHDAPLTAELRIHAAMPIGRCSLIDIDTMHMAIVADCRLHYAYSRSRLWRDAIANLLESLQDVPLTAGLRIHAATSIE
jgi:CRISPR/Cas system-associated exonuclease Cas4 (RecB family)